MAKEINRAKAGSIYGALRKRFRAKDGHSKKSPMDRLVYAMLALRSNSNDAERGLSAIRSSYVDWNEVRVASQRNLSALMRSKGCNPKSAKSITMFLQGLYQEIHTVSIAPIQKMSAKRAREYLQQITGLTAEQSAAIIVRTFDMPVAPVLPAIKRVLTRVGLATQNASDTRVHDVFQAVAAKGKASTAHRVLQMLATDFCLKDDPLCARCPVKKHCPTGQAIETAKKVAKKKAVKKKAAMKKTVKKKAAKKKAAKKKAAKKKAAKKKAVSKRRRPKREAARKVKKKTSRKAGKPNRKSKSPRRKKK